MVRLQKVKIVISVLLIELLTVRLLHTRLNYMLVGTVTATLLRATKALVVIRVLLIVLQ